MNADCNVRHDCSEPASSSLVAVTLVARARPAARSRAANARRAPGDWDAAVEYYRQAVQDDPDRAEYKIALERATFAAAGDARRPRAARPKRKAASTRRCASIAAPSELDPTNRQVAAKAAELERIIRDRIEAARPRPQIERLREQARKRRRPSRS